MKGRPELPHMAEANEKPDVVCVVNDRWVMLWCPGCESIHMTHIGVWTWNGNPKAPTINSSILVHPIYREDGSEYKPRCHFFVRDGMLEFLTDSTHALSGQTVSMQPVPDGW